MTNVLSDVTKTLHDNQNIVNLASKIPCFPAWLVKLTRHKLYLVCKNTIFEFCIYIYI